MSTLITNSKPWKLEPHEIFKLPWYSFVLFFLDYKLYEEYKERARQVNLLREKEKKNKFFKSRPRERVPQPKEKTIRPKEKMSKPLGQKGKVAASMISTESDVNAWGAFQNKTWGDINSRYDEFANIRNIPSNPIWLPCVKNEDLLPLIGVIPGSMTYVESIRESVMWNGVNWIVVKNLPPDFKS